jgi:hypothetical protein
MGFATSIQQVVCLAGDAGLYTLWSWVYQADACMTGPADHMLQDKMLLLFMMLLLFQVVQMLVCCTITRRLDAQGSKWCRAAGAEAAAVAEAHVPFLAVMVYGRGACT